MASISSFKGALSNGGARANQFTVGIAFTGASLGGTDFSFLCKASAMPASTIGDVPVNYRGRILHYAGDREWADWQITVYNETDFAARKGFEAWQALITAFGTTDGKVAHTDYSGTATVQQLDKNDAILATYTFDSIWPSDIGQITLDYDSNNAIETFDVVFKHNGFIPS